MAQSSTVAAREPVLKPGNRSVSFTLSASRSSGSSHCEVSSLHPARSMQQSNMLIMLGFIVLNLSMLKLVPAYPAAYGRSSMTPPSLLR